GEQTGVVDGDEGRLGEIAQQLDLLVAERAHLLTVDGENTNGLIFFEHRHTNRRTHAAQFDGLPNRRVVRIYHDPEVFDVDYLSRPGGAATGRVLEPMRARLEKLGVGFWHADQGSSIEGIAVISEQNAEFGLAKSHRVLQQGLEHGRELPRRA